MIEKTIYNYLSERLDCPVALERDNQSAPFVLFEKTGSTLNNFINTASIAFQSYGRTMLEAAELNEQVKTAILEMRELDGISKCSLNGDYNFTDTSTEDYRYQALFDITY